MLLNEVFDRPVNWRITKENDETIQCSFVVGQITYRFAANPYDYDGFKICDIEFGVEPTTGTKLSHKERFGITNTGNQQTVFATVVDIMSFIVDEVKPDQMIFTADEPSRTRLYLHMLRRLLPDWEVSLDKARITVTSPDAYGLIAA